MKIMKLLYGTTNQAKLDAMRKGIQIPLGIEIVGLKELNCPLPFIEESGNDPLENAKLKALAYYEAFGIPVFSCDSGLYFDELEDTSQPGTHIRRVDRKELNDEEMISHYAGLAGMNGGKLTGRYKNAIYLILDTDKHFYSMDESLFGDPFVLVDKPHPKRVTGFPLDSLSVKIESGKYYYDLEDCELAQSAVEIGIRHFFENVLSKIGK